MAKGAHDILVSVCVITYNSSKTIIETLNSIYNQTYQNIELIISDDCSKDDTIEICRQWIEGHKKRFKKTRLLTVEKNTGVSGNFNRAETACQGEWVKPIAGDDLLMPNCVQDCVNYVAGHLDTVYMFGKQEAFGAGPERCQQIDRLFDYSFFELPIEEQLHHLIFTGNCVPAPTAFFNSEKVRELGIYNDERVPLIEDWPKWIVCLKKGVRFGFVDKVLVKYRIGGVSTGYRLNESVFLSERQLCFRYLYPEWYKADAENAIERVINDELLIYRYLLDSNNRLKQLESSNAYRLGKAILKPFKWFKR